jgi:hypothetical protein
MMLALRLLLIDLFEWMKILATTTGAEERESLPFGAGKAPQGRKTLPYSRRVRV